MSNEQTDFIRSSNNYNMKNQPLRYTKALDLLYAISTLREDSTFFTRLLLLQGDKKTRGKHQLDLSDLQQRRVKQQLSLFFFFEGIEMNEVWKNALFSFSNKIYKMMKSFHHKVLNISTKIAEISETSLFMQNFRNLCIEKLAETSHVKTFLNFLVESLRRNNDKQVGIYSSNISCKVIQSLRKEESAKINRYLPLFKGNGPDIYIESHRKALCKVDLELKKMAKETKEPQYHPYYQYSYLMNLDEDIDPHTFSFQNGISISFSYLEQGLCEFIVGKWVRILKDMKNKNEFNEKVINPFRQRYQQFQRKSKISASKIHHRFSKVCLKEDRENIDGERSIEMTDFSSYFELKNPNQVNNAGEKEDLNSGKTKKLSIFKINKVESRKRSHTLRPLCDSKQNKEVIHQKIIEMRLVEATPQIIKNMRIRKRRPLLQVKDESSWSVLMRDKPHTSKLAICIH